MRLPFDEGHDVFGRGLHNAFHRFPGVACHMRDYDHIPHPQQNVSGQDRPHLMGFAVAKRGGLALREPRRVQIEPSASAPHPLLRNDVGGARALRTLLDLERNRLTLGQGLEA